MLNDLASAEQEQPISGLNGGDRAALGLANLATRDHELLDFLARLETGHINHYPLGPAIVAGEGSGNDVVDVGHAQVSDHDGEHAVLTRFHPSGKNAPDGQRKRGIVDLKPLARERPSRGRWVLHKRCVFGLTVGVEQAEDGNGGQHHDDDDRGDNHASAQDGLDRYHHPSIAATSQCYLGRSIQFLGAGPECPRFEPID